MAIDRFTGGVAGSAKFDAEAVYQPVLAGTITIDLKRMPLWGLGLLALVLRDLMEGDIPLGFGAGKGYGACKAEIKGLQIAGLETTSTEFQTILKHNELTPEALNNLDVTSVPPMEVQLALMDLIKAFHQKVSIFGKDSLPKRRT